MEEGLKPDSIRQSNTEAAMASVAATATLQRGASGSSGPGVPAEADPLVDVPNETYFEDVFLQMESAVWADRFNAMDPPKKIHFLHAHLIEIEDDVAGAVAAAGAAAAAGADAPPPPPGASAACVPCDPPAPPSGMFAVERYIEGEYLKHNSNSGYINEQHRMTPQAFSHFTYASSSGGEMVVDIQGVGDLWTDPQIHSDKLRYGESIRQSVCQSVCQCVSVSVCQSVSLSVCQSALARQF